MTPWTVARQPPLSRGSPRQEYWSGLPFPFPGHLPNPGVEPAFPALAGRFFTAEPDLYKNRNMRPKKNKPVCFWMTLNWLKWILNHNSLLMFVRQIIKKRNGKVASSSRCLSERKTFHLSYLFLIHHTGGNFLSMRPGNYTETGSQGQLLWVLRACVNCLPILRKQWGTNA